MKIKVPTRSIREATLGKDVNQNKTAQEYIKKAMQLITEFPNKYVEYNQTQKFIGVKVGAFTFYFYDKRSIYTLIHGHNRLAMYDAQNNAFNIFHLDIEFKNKKPELNLGGRGSEIVHEVIHFLDMKKTEKHKGSKETLSKMAAGTDMSDHKKYANDPYELNAHFQEYVMPLINNYLEHKEQIPVKFDEFKAEVMKVLGKDKSIRDFYAAMTPENKKRFMKRIAVYYQSFKDYVAKDPEVKFDNENTRLEIQQDALQKFFSKVGSLFKKGSQ